MSSDSEARVDPLDKLRVRVAPIADKIKHDVVAYAGDIVQGPDRAFAGMIKARKRHDDVILILATQGGSADAAYRIARALQRNYRSFTLCVDTGCKSAGTLIALAADSIVMSDCAELGPLDVQLAKPDELAEWTSGLTPIQGLSTLRQQTFKYFENYFLDIRLRSQLQVTTKTALDVAAKMATGLFQPIFEQIDPMRLGEVQRAMTIAHDYGMRLARENVKSNGLARLIADYPSHGFVIDRDEAMELFEIVREPSEEEVALIELSYDLLSHWDETDKVFFDVLSSPVNPLPPSSPSPQTNGAANVNHSIEGDGKGDHGPTRPRQPKSVRPARPAADTSEAKSSKRPSKAEEGHSLPR